MAKTLGKIAGVVGGLAVIMGVALGVKKFETGYFIPPSRVVEMNLTRFDSYLDPRGREEQFRKDITVKKGDPFFLHYSLFDEDGIAETRLYINDSLIDSHKHSPLGTSKKYATNHIGLINGDEFKTSDERFRVGNNTIAYEIVSPKEEVTRGAVKVIVFDDKD